MAVFLEAQVEAALQLAVKSVSPGTLGGSTLLDAMLRASPPFRHFEGGRIAISAHLPLAVHAAITGSAVEAESLAAALTALEAGIYALDHLMDDELATPLDAWPQETTMLCAASLVSYVPLRLLAKMTCDDATSRQIHERLGDALARIATGQAQDIATKSGQSSSSDIEQAIYGKTGERRALYASVAAILAGASRVAVEAYGDFARHLGVARQMNSDLADAFSTSASRDLTSGVRTLPVAFYLERQPDAARERMLAALESCRRDVSAHEEVRQLLRSSNCLRELLKRKELHCELARQRLADARPRAPADSWLLKMIDAASITSLTAASASRRGEIAK